MFRKLHIILAVSLITILYSCNTVPDNAKYIPKNAIAVLGINAGEIGKKIAWNVLTGSKLFDDINKKQGTLNVEEMGIELMGTTYVYIKDDKRFTNGNKITCLIPLDDAAKWEAFVKKTFTGVAVKEQGSRKAATLADGMYACWNDDMLVVMNAIQMPQDYTAMAMSAGDTTYTAPPLPAIDEAQIAAEMENAFTITKENALTENKKFTSLETQGHDITLWINYDEIMKAYGNEEMTDMTGMAINNVLWKDAAFTAGFDFEKGKIAGDMRYYSPEEMKEVAKEMGKNNVDKDMLQMLPLENPNMLFAWHLSPAGLKGTLEKLGVLGFINLALTGQNMNIDDILNAFTGDMAATVTDFKLTKQLSQPDTAVTDSLTVNFKTRYNYTSDATFTYVLKINKKENFNKLLGMAVSEGLLKTAGANTYTAGPGDFTVMVNDKYIAVSNKKDDLAAILQGKMAGGKMHKDISASHPLTMFFNTASMMNSVDASLTGSPRDSMMIAESKKLVANATFTGGEFKGDAFKYNMAINFNNKEENTLLQLMDFAIRMSEANKQTTLAASR